MNDRPEIGGYFELERGRGTLFHEEGLALNCGRGCLRYLLEAHEIKEIWLPSYLCYVVSDTCKEMGVTVLLYDIDASFAPVWDFDIAKGQWLYLVDYYGQLDDACIENARKASEGRLIVDETHGYFTPPREGIDTLYSCRKYLGVPDGGFLYPTKRIERALPRDVSYERMEYLLGRVDLGSGAFLEASRKNNDALGTHGLRMMSALTESLLRNVDYPFVISAREKNFAVLDEALGAANQLHPTCPPGAFAYPLLVRDGSTARGRLAARGVFVPCLWPEVADEYPEESIAHRYSRDILPLPIDQRYSEEDMEYIVACIHDEGIA